MNNEVNAEMPLDHTAAFQPYIVTIQDLIERTIKHVIQVGSRSRTDPSKIYTINDIKTLVGSYCDDSNLCIIVRQFEYIYRMNTESGFEIEICSQPYNTQWKTSILNNTEDLSYFLKAEQFAAKLMHDLDQEYVIINSIYHNNKNGTTYTLRKIERI